MGGGSSGGMCPTSHLSVEWRRDGGAAGADRSVTLHLDSLYLSEVHLIIPVRSLHFAFP